MTFTAVRGVPSAALRARASPTMEDAAAGKQRSANGRCYSHNRLSKRANRPQNPYAREHQKKIQTAIAAAQASLKQEQRQLSAQKAALEKEQSERREQHAREEREAAERRMYNTQSLMAARQTLARKQHAADDERQQLRLQQWHEYQASEKAKADAAKRAAAEKKEAEEEPRRQAVRERNEAERTL